MYCIKLCFSPPCFILRKLYSQNFISAVAHIHYAPHVVLREAGLTFDLEKVDLSGKITAGGTDFKDCQSGGLRARTATG
jgi:hypothetical protein